MIGRQSTPPPATNAVLGALGENDEVRPKVSIASFKFDVRRPASARGEPHGNGETYLNARRIIPMRTAGSIIVWNSGTEMASVDTGVGTRARLKNSDTEMKCTTVNGVWFTKMETHDFTFTFHLISVLIK